MAWFGAGMLLLALEDVQSILAAPDLSAELLFVLALVLSLCSARWPGDDGVVRAHFSLPVNSHLFSLAEFSQPSL